MKKLYSNSYLITGVIYIVCALIVLISIEIGGSFESYHLITLCAAIGLLPLIYSEKNSHQFAPSRLLALSICIFILARPIISAIQDIELIEVGNGITDQNIFKTLIVVSIFIWIIGISFVYTNLAIKTSTIKLYICFKPALRFPITGALKTYFLITFLSLGIAFIIKSIDAAAMMTGVDYFTVISDPEFHNHLFLFFLSKNFGLVWVLTARTKNAIKLYTGALLMFSFGFLMIGLRGYFVAYLFIFLYFYYENRRINFFTLSIIGVSLLYISSLILEYRLGYELFSNKLSMITSPFYQQGATFEVVFGTVVYTEELLQCLSLNEYFLTQIRFGDCVDLVRGVPFIEGGFASSILAEAYFLGIIPFLIVGFLIGSTVAILNKLSNISRLSQDEFIAGLFLLTTLPNLVYIARSGAFDFIFKFFLIALVLKIFFTRVKHHQQPSQIYHLK